MQNNLKTLEAEAFVRLLNIMDELREKCPWDREQTFDSIRHLSLEEIYELSDAIVKKDYEELKNELGDVLLHIVFYAKIASETKLFNITEVIHQLCDKLIKRHPHIYGTVEAKDSETVKENWEQIKKKENKDGSFRSVLAGVPAAAPSLVKAYRMQEKAAQVGFDWDNKKQVFDKIKEEITEFEEAQTQEEKTAEFGDILFALVNYARHNKINPDDALEMTNHKFRTRFQSIEHFAERDGKDLRDMTLNEMENLWQKAKNKE